MSGALVQDLLVGVIVIGAASWLVVRGWRRRGKASGCEHCPAAAAGNPPCQAAPSDTLVTIGPGTATGSSVPQGNIRR